MLNLLNPFTNHSEFQKNLRCLTRLNFDAPQEQIMKSIINTLRGEDQQTRSQIAFASIIKSLHGSSSKNNWIFLLKNLIILDRLTSQNFFCQQISTLSVPCIEKYQNQDNRAISIGAACILTNYWHLIQKISQLKLSKSNILFYKRSFRKHYLSTLDTHQVLYQLQILQDLFSMTYNLITKISGTSIEDQENIRKTQTQTKKNNSKNSSEFLNSKLVQYLIMHFYSKMLTYYSCQYLSIYRFVDILLHHTKNDKIILEDVKKFSKMAALFRINSNDMTFISQYHKHVKGFQHVDAKEFSGFSQEHIIKAVQDYLNQKSKYQEFKKKLQPLQHQNNQIDYLTVQKKPLIMQHLNSNQIKSPRKKVDCPKDDNDYNQFQNYISSTSDFFPNKQIMTLDLIMQLRKQEQEEEKMQKQNKYFNSKKQINLSKEIIQQREQMSIHDCFLKEKQKYKIYDILIWGHKLKIKQKNQEEQSGKLKKQTIKNMFSCLDLKYLQNRSQFDRNSLK